MTIICRIIMQISESLCSKEKILSMTTGESLGQVASQTMASMNAINEVTNLPILRPLVALDKEEIIKISKEIGTYDISIRPYEDCCTIFVPSAPVTNPKREKVVQMEAQVDFEKEIETAINNTETIRINHTSKAEEPFSD